MPHQRQGATTERAFSPCYYHQVVTLPLESMQITVFVLFSIALEVFDLLNSGACLLCPPMDLRMLLEYKLLLSLGAIFLFVFFRYIAVKIVRRRHKANKEARRHSINMIKNLTNFSTVIVLMVLWANEVQNFALSLAAFAVAIVLATREFIQCITGFIYLGSNRIFRVGDWVQIGEHMGEVTENDWLKVILLEVETDSYDYTGRSLVVPNSMMLTHPVKNLNFLKRYATHSFELVRDGSVNVFEFTDELKAQAKAYCEHFSDVANRYNNLIEKRLEVPIAGPEPSLRVSTNYLGQTVVTLTIFCPTEEAIEIEQKLTRDFMQMWFAQKAQVNHPDETEVGVSH